MRAPGCPPDEHQADSPRRIRVMNHQKRRTRTVGHRCGVEPAACNRQRRSCAPCRPRAQTPQAAADADAAGNAPETPPSRQQAVEAGGGRPRPAPIDGGWPRLANLPSGGTILVYQPQVASWDKQKHLVAFSAVSYRAKAADKPAIGTIKLEADTKVALERASGQLSEDEDRRSQLPDAAERAGARGRRRDRQGDSR